mgnify:CR=1 FL=1
MVKVICSISISPYRFTCNLVLLYHSTGSGAYIHLHVTLLHCCGIATDVVYFFLAYLVSYTYPFCCWLSKAFAMECSIREHARSFHQHPTHCKQITILLHGAQYKRGCIVITPLIIRCSVLLRLLLIFGPISLQLCNYGVSNLCYFVATIPYPFIAQCQLYVSLGTPHQHIGLLHHIFIYGHTFLWWPLAIFRLAVLGCTPRTYQPSRCTSVAMALGAQQYRS